MQKKPQSVANPKRDDVLHMATHASYTQRRWRDIPEDLSPGAKEVALLTSVTKAQAATIKPMGQALETLKALGSDIWPASFLVAKDAIFEWKTAPWREYVSFEDFYDRELAGIYGDYQSFVRDYASVIRGSLSEDEAAKRANNRTLAKHGGDRRSKKFQASGRSLVYGESEAYVTARIERDHPSDVAAIEAGLTNWKDAGRQLGFIKPDRRIRLSDDPRRAAVQLRTKFGEAFVSALISALHELMQ